MSPVRVKHLKQQSWWYGNEHKRRTTVSQTSLQFLIVFFCDVNAMMMRMLMSVSLYHSAVPTSFPRQICPSSRHTLPANDLYPVYVEICTFLENGFLLFWTERFAQTWYMRICARLLIQKLESNQSKSTNCSKFRPCEHETPIFLSDFAEEFLRLWSNCHSSESRPSLNQNDQRGRWICSSVQTVTRPLLELLKAPGCTGPENFGIFRLRAEVSFSWSLIISSSLPTAFTILAMFRE